MKEAKKETEITIPDDKLEYLQKELTNIRDDVRDDPYIEEAIKVLTAGGLRSTKRELEELGIKPSIVSSHSVIESEAKKVLKLDTPFGSGTEKWQLPIDMMPIRVAKTIFPKNTRVDDHVHPESTAKAPGGGLRIVTQGNITFQGRTYEAGDWFFVPNGVPYEFLTSEEQDTIVFYSYFFFGAMEGNRFSHPH